MQIAAVQFDVTWEDRQANFRRVRELVDATDVQPGGLIVLCEMFATGYTMNVAAAAEEPGGPTERFAAELARRTQACVAAGVVTTADDGRGLNQAIAVDPGGDVLGRYTKMHPFGFAGETEHYAAGSELVTFNWGGMTVCPAICYDLRFPELFRAGARRGVEVFLVPANWPAPRRDHWRTLLRARAIENQAYVVGVNRCGADPKVGYSGDSLIIGPRGEVLADAGEDEGVIRATADAEALAAWRREFPALDDAQGDLA